MLNNSRTKWAVKWTVIFFGTLLSIFFAQFPKQTAHAETLSNFFNQLYSNTDAIVGEAMNDARNNFTGNVGYEFTPNQNITVKALGRAVGIGRVMSYNHDIIIWRVSDQSIVAKATLLPSSPHDSLNYKYELLKSPVTLASGTAYRITSSEASGGDKWMNLAQNIGNHQAIASIQQGVSSDYVGLYPNKPYGGAEQGFGPPTFFTATGDKLSDTNFFNGVSAGTPRNNATGTVGYEFVPSGDIRITALGRSVSGSMNDSHDITVWRVNDQSVVATIKVTPGSSSDSLGYKYELLGKSVLLQSGVTYRIVSSETSNGDFFNDLATIGSPKPVATITSAAYGSTGVFPSHVYGGTNQVYGPPTFYTEADLLPANFFKQVYTGTRNDVTANVGYEFTPTQDITVTALGRGLSGAMNYDHDITVWRVSDQTVMAGTTVSPRSGTDATGYKYELLNHPVTLKAGITYRIVSSEMNGGDAWSNLASISNHSSVAGITQGVSGNVGVYPNAVFGAAESGFNSVTFYYGNIRQPINLARTLPPAQAVYTSSSYQGIDKLGMGYASSPLGTPTNRVFVVDGRRNSDVNFIGWASNNGIASQHTEWITINTGAVNKIDTVDLYPRSDVPGAYFPADFKIQVSSDNSTWTDVVTQTNYPQPTSGGVQRFTFPEVNAQYVRVLCTALRPYGGDFRVVFGEIEIYNLAKSSDAPNPKSPALPRTVNQGYLIDGKSNGNAFMSSWDMDTVGASLESDIANNFLIIKRNAHLRPFQMSRSFPVQTSGKITMEWLFKMDQAADGLEFQLRSGSVPAVGFLTKNGYLSYMNPPAAPGGAPVAVPMVPYVANQLYGIKIIADVSLGKADIYVNGQIQANQVPFWNSISNLDNFAVKNGQIANNRVYLNPVSIYKGYAVNERFLTTIDGSAPSDWTIAASGGDSGSTYSMESTLRPDTYSLMLDDTSSNAVSAEKAIPSVSGDANTHTLIYEYNFMLPAKMNGFATEIADNSAAAVKIVTDGGFISYVDSSAVIHHLYNYKANVWYKIKVVANMSTHTADIYMNGRLLQSATTFANPSVNSINKVKFSTSAANTGIAYIDDILIYDLLPQPTDYVPAPVTVSHAPYLLGMQACPLWREGTNGGGYDFIRNNIDRTPIIGFYDEGNAESTDWELKYLIEHGIDFVQYCWFGATKTWKTSTSPIKTTQYTGPSIEDGLYNAQYSNQMKFTIMWTNYDSNGTDFMNGNYETYFKNNIWPYWVEHYFKDPRYLTIGNKPVISIFYQQSLGLDFGKGLNPDAYIKTNIIDWMTTQLQNEGFAGGLFLAQRTDGDPVPRQQIKNRGFNHTYRYAFSTQAKMQQEQNENSLAGLHAIAAPSVNWSKESWQEPQSYEGFQRDPLIFQDTLDWVKNTLMPANTDTLSQQMVLFDNWNEYGEGHVIMPTVGNGFGYLDAIRSVFTGNPSHTDIVPTEAQRSRFDTLYPHGDW